MVCLHFRHYRVRTKVDMEDVTGDAFLIRQFKKKREPIFFAVVMAGWNVTSRPELLRITHSIHGLTQP